MIKISRRTTTRTRTLLLFALVLVTSTKATTSAAAATADSLLEQEEIDDDDELSLIQLTADKLLPGFDNEKDEEDTPTFIDGNTIIFEDDLTIISQQSGVNEEDTPIIPTIIDNSRGREMRERNPPAGGGGGHQQQRPPPPHAAGGGGGKKKKGGGNKLGAETFDTIGYKHQEGTGSVSLLWFTMAFMIVVLPPAVFICIYSPGECLIAIGIAQLFIGGILHYVHSQDPYQFKYPWHTSPYLYVVTGFLWILAGLWKLHIQTQISELEQEEANERRRKYSERRTQWDEETSRERRRREREQRRRRKQQQQLQRTSSGRKVSNLPPPFPLNRGPSAYELVPLNQRKSSTANQQMGYNHIMNGHHGPTTIPYGHGPTIPSWDGDEEEDESFHTV